MIEQLTQCHRIFAKDAKGRGKSSQTIVEPNFLFAYEKHQSNRGSERLSQGSKIKDGARLHGTVPRAKGTCPERSLVNDFIFPANEEHGSGKYSLSHRFSECAFD